MVKNKWNSGAMKLFVSENNLGLPNNNNLHVNTTQGMLNALTKFKEELEKIGKDIVKIDFDAMIRSYRNPMSSKDGDEDDEDEEMQQSQSQSQSQSESVTFEAWENSKTGSPTRKKVKEEQSIETTELVDILEQLKSTERYTSSKSRPLRTRDAAYVPATSSSADLTVMELDEDHIQALR
jgi:Asp-tRNA(Asn)/Glu-tRNA(Gln) amidotransferase A subunit family amidase